MQTIFTHPCIESDRKASNNCSDCPVHAKGFCDKFRVVLRKIANHLNSRYTGIPPEDRRDIFAITIENAIRSVGEFEGRRGAKFSTWVWQIYRNKLNDYFRKKEPIAFGEIINQEKEGWHDPSHDTERKIMIAECFRKHLPQDDSGCVRLYLDLYSFLQNGKTQKELAEMYHLSPNTLNQRIKRCRKIMRHLFRACLEIEE